MISDRKCGTILVRYNSISNSPLEGPSELQSPLSLFVNTGGEFVFRSASLILRRLPDLRIFPVPLYRMVVLPLLVLTLYVACSEEDVSGPQSTSDEIQVEIGEGTTFDITFSSARGVNESIAGPFRLSGTSLGYSDSLQALLVDLVVTNESNETVDLPVALAFLGLYPEGVTVNNSDNGVAGSGAQIEFSFIDRDVYWTPGEASLSRTVEFGVDPGTSIGFTGELLAGFVKRQGTIAGRVWNDINADGVMDVGEPGVVTTLVLETDLLPAVLETTSGDDGRFAFTDLVAGTYMLRKENPAGYSSTTPDDMFIVLESYNGVVDTFDDANFGCHQTGTIFAGDWIDAYGSYNMTDGIFYAASNDHISCPCKTQVESMIGPVTGIDPYMGPAVMGVQVWAASCGYNGTLETGDRASLCCFWYHHAWGLIGTICPVSEPGPDEVHGYVSIVGDGVYSVAGVTVVGLVAAGQ